MSAIKYFLAETSTNGLSQINCSKIVAFYPENNTVTVKTPQTEHEYVDVRLTSESFKDLLGYVLTQQAAAKVIREKYA